MKTISLRTERIKITRRYFLGSDYALRISLQLPLRHVVQVVRGVFHGGHLNNHKVTAREMLITWRRCSGKPWHMDNSRMLFLLWRQHLLMEKGLFYALHFDFFFVKMLDWCPYNRQSHQSVWLGETLEDLHWRTSRGRFFALDSSIGDRWTGGQTNQLLVLEHDTTYSTWVLAFSSL